MLLREIRSCYHGADVLNIWRSGNFETEITYSARSMEVALTILTSKEPCSLTPRQRFRPAGDRLEGRDILLDLVAPDRSSFQKQQFRDPPSFALGFGKRQGAINHRNRQRGVTLGEIRFCKQ